MLDSLRNRGVRTPLSGPVADGIYILQLGDTLDGIAERFGLTDLRAYAELRHLNPALAAGRHVPGGMVRIPASAQPQEIAAASDYRSSSSPVETHWTRGFGRDVTRQNRYNAEISGASGTWDRIDPFVLKSLLAQESNLTPNPNTNGNYRGIAQIGRDEARSAGLRVGRGVDERLDPKRAIPAAAAVLKQKASALQRGFDRYGTPAGDDYWSFVTTAYNAGEGVVLDALRRSYGTAPPAQVRWSDLVATRGGGRRGSPLYQAALATYGTAKKADEIYNYALQIMQRARQ